MDKYVKQSDSDTDVDALERRLNTYLHWNNTKSSLQLATAGFIYTGLTDKVECQSCGIRLYNWQEADDPLVAHKMYAPDCQFMVKNFPHIQPPPKTKIMTVKYPQYSDYDSRLQTFDRWPLKCIVQKPDMMARAGFFYVGSADRVRCFHCGITMRDWDTCDHPASVHLEWSSNCPYVQKINVGEMVRETEEEEKLEDLTTEFENSIFIDMHKNKEEGVNDPQELQQNKREERKESLRPGGDDRIIIETLQEYGYKIEHIQDALNKLSHEGVKYDSIDVLLWIEKNR